MAAKNRGITMQLTHRPVAFWSWNDKLEREEILRQTDEFKSKGYGGLIIHARGGLVTEYLSEEWFDMVKAAVCRAAELGLEVWIYDEFGWPSGFAGGKVVETDPAYAMPRLQVGIPPADAEICAAYKKEKDGYRLTGAADADLYAYVTYNNGYVNLLDAGAVDTFINVTHEQYKKHIGKYFGGTVKGFFTDEPQIYMDFPYCCEMEKEYEREYGESFLPQLWRLAHSDGFDLFRYRFYKLAGKLFRKNFTKKIADWCGKNGLAFTGHFSNEDGLIASQANCGLEEHYALMQVPAIDFCGKRLMSFVPLAHISSAARLFEKKYVMAEAFGCCGWDNGIADMQYLWGSLAVMGVNKPCLHLSAYSMRGARKRDYPAFYSYQSESWRYMGLFGDWCEKVNSFMDEGESMNDVLVLSPLNTVLSIGLRCAHARELSNAYRTLIEGLYENQVFFDVAEESVFQRGEVRGNKLRVLSGRYSRIILPECDFIEEETYLLLCEAAKNGVQIALCEKIPRVLTRGGEFCPFTAEATVIYNRADLWRKYFDAVKYARPVYVRDRYFRPAKGVTAACRRGSGGLRILLFNRDADAKELRLCLEKECAVSVFCGLNAPCEEYYAKDGLVDLTLSGRSLAAIRCSAPSPKEKPETMAEKIIRLTPISAARVSENVLTLDRARISTDGIHYGERIPVIRFKELDLPRSERLYVKYEWTAEFCPAALEVAAETYGAEEAYVNGLPVRFGERWFIDRSVHRADITAAVKTGKNELVFVYKNTVCDKERFTFETQANMHTEKAEYESVYLLGDFGVRVDSFERKCGYLAAKGELYLAENVRAEPDRELTEQGLWFYRGDVDYNYTFAFAESEMSGRSVFVKARFHGVALEIWLNGKYCGAIASDADRVDITPYLCGGENRLTARLTVSLRNCLGPHHHVTGEPYAVTPLSFAGKSSTIDKLMCPVYPANTWTDDYNFVENGIFALALFVR